jgi:plastocyanin
MLGAILALSAGGCSGTKYGSGGTGSMSMPAPSTTGSSSAVTVTIVGPNTGRSFDPNPAPVAQGALVVWRNTDTTPHRIVMNDGSFDTGNIMPGSSSQTMRLSSSGGSYHCTIHPTMMFGSINVATTEPPMPPGY